MSYSAENTTNEPGVSLVDLMGTHWRLMILITGACIGIAGLITVVMPRRYESRMKFLVNNERTDLVLTPESNKPMFPLSEVTEMQVNSEMELIKSRDIIENVIRDQKLYEIKKQTSTDTAASKLEIARAIQKFEGNLGVNAIRKSNIVEVAFKATDPDIAVSVLTNLGDRYLNAHLAAHSPPGTYKFFTDQVQKYSEQLVQARAALSDFHRAKHLYSMTEQQSNVLNSLQAANGRLNDLDVDLEGQRARLAEARRQLAASPQRLTTQVRTVPNQLSVQQLQTTLTDLRNKRIGLASKFKGGDRLLTEVDDQIANTSRDMEQMKLLNAEERTTDVDVVHQAVQGEYLRNQITYSGLEKQRSELVRVRNEYVSQLSSMDENYVALQNLEEYKKEAQDNYDRYVKRLDEARLADSLDREKFSNVTIIEKPVYSPIPISPRLTLNLAAGAIFGLFLAFGAAFALTAKGGRSGSAAAASKAETIFPSRTYQPASGD